MSLIRFQRSSAPIAAKLILLLTLQPALAVTAAVAPQSSEAMISSASRIQPVRPDFNFPRQTLHYEAEYRFWTAGVATVRVEQAGTQERILGTADSTGVVALLFRVQDRFESYFDGKTMCSQKLVKHTEEGSRRRDTVLTFDYSRKKAVLEETNLKTGQRKREENDIPSCATDVLSGILYGATLPLQEGATYTFPLNDGGKTVTVNAHVEGKEQLKTPAGTFQTVRVQPVGDSGVLKNRGRVWVWYTDDAQHLPVQMKSKLTWGTLTVYLTMVEK
ncbi:MAG: DUF3108 domain-containing protein [Acetobacteraceae bacterium]|nr:DUF3108 domain-containing protein [Acetobacteraceae bacterium]